MQTPKYLIEIISLMLLLLLTIGCNTPNPKICSPPSPPPPPPLRDLPPILAQDELFRPYAKLGRIRITREVYGIFDSKIFPDIREWGYSAIRAEAEKMRADAVILPEVTGATTTYLFLPSTEYRATGVAIKFK
ncbi:MAG: hypothetical protein WC156_00505 [Pedobacter sp.]